MSVSPIRRNYIPQPFGIVGSDGSVTYYNQEYADKLPIDAAIEEANRVLEHEEREEIERIFSAEKVTSAQKFADYIEFLGN